MMELRTNRIKAWVSLVPAAAVIPAPIAYINVAVVKKLVVGFLWSGCMATSPASVGGVGLVEASDTLCVVVFYPLRHTRCEL